MSAFTTLSPEDLIISNEGVTNTVWLNNSPTLQAYFTSSVQVQSTTGQFYYNIYSGISTTGSIQFAIAYCDEEGSGSLLYNPNVDGLSPTRTNYGQYRSLVIGDEENSFVFGNQSASYFYALPIERSGYKEQLLPGTMTLCISGSGAGGTSPNPVERLFLTDDSKLGGAAQFTEAGRVYNLVSGSAGNVFTGTQANGWTVNSGSYGWFMPDVGMILLNGPALDGTVAEGGINLGIGRVTNQADNNPQKLYNRLNLAGSGFTNAGWTLNSEEQLSSDFIFVRARSQEYNYSSNPSFISGSTGAVLFDSFINNPQVYITAVGLYNNNQELVAVAKLSRPLLKDFTKELLVRVKLDF